MSTLKRRSLLSLIFICLEVLFQENCKIGKKCPLKYHYHGNIVSGPCREGPSYEEVGDTRCLA